MNDYLIHAKDKMDNTLINLDDRYTKIRAGRANPSMLDGIMVSYYGTPTPIKSVANISVPEARQLNIKPFDRSIVGAIEKAIFEANLGVTPSNNGESVFITIPFLTEERRKDLVKQAKEYTEDARIAVRNIRRDIIEDIKKDEYSEDEEKNLTNELQKIVDDYNKQIDDAFKLKEKDLMEI